MMKGLNPTTTTSPAASPTQVANYHISTLPFSGNLSRTAWALNRILNDDVRILGYGLAPSETFDPISDNIGKEYRYTIDTSPIQVGLGLVFVFFFSR